MDNHFLGNVLPILILPYYKGMYYTAIVFHPYWPHINNYWIPMPYLSSRGLGGGEAVHGLEATIVKNHLSTIPFLSNTLSMIVATHTPACQA